MYWKNLVKTFFLLVTSFTLIPTILSANDQDLQEAIAEGEQLFQTHCQQCHAVNQEVIGPELANVNERLDKDWLIRFIRNSQEVIREGDEYAVALYEEYNQMVMPAVDLSDDEIRSILAYIEHESEEEEAEPVAATNDETTRPAAAPEAAPADTANINRLLIFISVLLLIIIILAFNILVNLLRLNDVDVKLNPDDWINWQKINPILMPTFLLVGFALLIYELTIHNQYVVFPNMPSASEHGTAIDNMFIATLIITGIVFIATQILLFVFAYKYRHQNSRKAYFYPDNNKLEIFWTAIPAIVLTVLVLFGYDSWRNITYEKATDDELPEVEVLGEQFSWTFRYPGESGEFGAVNYKLFEENPMGIDFEDDNARDDIVTRELYLPVDQEVILRFRSKDVIHSAHLPHFRLQMYTTPGMPSRFRFKPTKTTAEMREYTGNENFEYELACNQICGVAHYNMRSVVRVVEQEEYDEWLAEQESYYERRQRR